MKNIRETLRHLAVWLCSFMFLVGLLTLGLLTAPLVARAQTFKVFDLEVSDTFLTIPLYNRYSVVVPNSGDTENFLRYQTLILNPSGPLASLTFLFPNCSSGDGVEGGYVAFSILNSVTSLSMVAEDPVIPALTSVTGPVGHVYVCHQATGWMMLN